MRRTRRCSPSLAARRALLAPAGLRRRRRRAHRSTPAASSTSSSRSSSSSPRRPGIDIEVRDGTTADLALLIDDEGDRSPADVFLSQSPGAVGYLDEPRPARRRCPTTLLDAVPAEDHAPDGHWVGLTGRVRTLVYNPELDRRGRPAGLGARPHRPPLRRPARRRARQRARSRTSSPACAASSATTPPSSSSTGIAANDADDLPQQRRHPRRRQPGRDRHGPDQPLLLVRGRRRGPRPAEPRSTSSTTGDLGSMLLVTAASVLDTSDARRARRTSSSSSCSARQAQTLLRRGDARVPAGRRRRAGRGPVPARRASCRSGIDFDALGDLDRDHRHDRRERVAGPMTTVAVERLVPVAEAPAPDRAPVGGRSSAARTRPPRRRRRRRRRLRRPPRLPRLAVRRRSTTSSTSSRRATRCVPLRSTVTLAVAVAGVERRGRHRPGLADDPHRPPVPPGLGGRRAAAARLPELHRRRRPARRGRARRPRRRAWCRGSTPARSRRSRASGGAWFVLTLFTYPYVYLPVAARLGVAAAVPRGVGAGCSGRSPLEVVPLRRAARRSPAPSGPARCSSSSTSCPTSAPSPSSGTGP